MYDLEEKFHKGYTSANWGNNSKIKKAMAASDNKDDDEEDSWEKNKQLKKKKQYLKQVAVRAEGC